MDQLWQPGREGGRKEGGNRREGRRGRGRDRQKTLADQQKVRGRNDAG